MSIKKKFGSGNSGVMKILKTKTNLIFKIKRAAGDYICCSKRHHIPGITRSRKENFVPHRNQTNNKLVSWINNEHKQNKPLLKIKEYRECTVSVIPFNHLILCFTKSFKVNGDLNYVNQYGRM